jgi:DNA gyrase subunit A
MNDGTAAAADVEAIARGAQQKLASARRLAHILTAVLRGLDQYDAVIATMRSSETAEVGRQRVAQLMNIDDEQAGAVTRLVADYDREVPTIADLESVVASPERLRDPVGTERGSYLAWFGRE